MVSEARIHGRASARTPFESTDPSASEAKLGFVRKMPNIFRQGIYNE
jgi:hypothetical protein